MQGGQVRHLDVKLPPALADPGHPQRPGTDAADPYRPGRKPRKGVVVQIGIRHRAEHGPGLRAHETQDAEMLGAVGHLDVREARGMPAQDILVMALGGRRAREIVALRGEPGDGELRCDPPGLGEDVHEPDSPVRPRRTIRAEALDEGCRLRSGDLEFRECREIDEARSIAYRAALGGHRLAPRGMPEGERRIARVAARAGP